MVFDIYRTTCQIRMTGRLSLHKIPARAGYPSQVCINKTVTWYFAMSDSCTCVCTVYRVGFVSCSRARLTPVTDRTRNPEIFSLLRTTRTSLLPITRPDTGETIYTKKLSKIIKKGIVNINLVILNLQVPS